MDPVHHEFESGELVVVREAPRHEPRDPKVARSDGAPHPELNAEPGLPGKRLKVDVELGVLMVGLFGREETK
jgi:hypothetical protein